MRALVDPDGTLGTRLTIHARAYEDMPYAIRRHDCSVMFYAGGAISELGRSPTRMAEVLACGRPVVGNKGVGDMAEILREHRVGVVLEGADPDQIASAHAALAELQRDPGLADRCRKTAQKLFSLSSGVEAYASIYRAILSAQK